MLPVVVGALATIPNATKGSLKEIKLSKIEINKLLRKLQNNSVTGTVNRSNRPEVFCKKGALKISQNSQ